MKARDGETPSPTRETRALPRCRFNPAIALAVIERLLPVSPMNRRRRSGVSRRHVLADRANRGSELDCYSYLPVARVESLPKNGGRSCPFVARSGSIFRSLVRFRGLIARLNEWTLNENGCDRLRLSSDKLFQSDVRFCLHIARHKYGG